MRPSALAYLGDLQGRVAARVAGTVDPTLVVLSASSQGKDLAPRVRIAAFPANTGERNAVWGEALFAQNEVRLRGEARRLLRRLVRGARPCSMLLVAKVRLPVTTALEQELEAVAELKEFGESLLYPQLGTGFPVTLLRYRVACPAGRLH